MLTTSTSVALGTLFVLLGGVNVCLVLEAWSRVKAAKTISRMLTLHRIGGYLFIALFCVMSYFMVARLRNGSADTSPNVTLHLTLAMVLSPLLFVKVLIARYYKNQQHLMLPIGLTIFVLAFVVIASTVGPHLARSTRFEEISIDPATAPPVTIDLNQASDLMQKRCSKCHSLDRVVGARKDAQGWVATVNRMRAIPSAAISDADAQIIVTYLASQAPPKSSTGDAKMEVARALIDQRCGRCHSLDRVYKAVETRDQWREIVTRMVGYAAGSTNALQAGEDQKIIDYLSVKQTPEAVAQRKAQPMAAASAARGVIALRASTPVNPSRGISSNRTAIGYISVVCLATLALAIKRPSARVPLATPRPGAAVKALGLVDAKLPSTPLLLELVKITQQTPNAKTLRFAVHGERKCDALPGQFLTFAFLFDGRKEIRCYSICSSAARSGYVEITPKRVENGCVSVFLNVRATVGMTVEATGPFGQFYFDAARDKNIVLVAAGSGISPMIGMLRYIDDLSLDTQVTLLYCVRTRNDIIFKQELEELQTRLKNLQYAVILSRPDVDWAGARGHISREFISELVPTVQGRSFFVCGPPPFMELTRTLLTGLGVERARIREESFGGAGASSKASLSSAAGFSIEFATSGKFCPVLEGQTILEAAAGVGVEIPAACRQGQCGTCKTRLLAGEVTMIAEQGLDAESKARGFVLTCVGHANGNVRLDA